MIKAAIFDVDGTLVNSVDAHARAWQDVFREFGKNIDRARIRSQIGKGGDQLLPVFLSKEEIDEHGSAIEARRGEILKASYLPDIKAFPGVRRLFERLRDAGIEIVLASSAKSDELQIYKKRAEITDLLDEETSSEDAEKSKPHPDIFQAALERLKGADRTQSIVIGDTPYDAEAASKAGIRTIGVLCGGFPEEDLRRSGCVAIFRDPEDLLANFRAWVGEEAIKPAA